MGVPLPPYPNRDPISGAELVNVPIADAVPVPLEPECPRCHRMAANVELHRKEVVRMFDAAKAQIKQANDALSTCNLNLQTSLRMAEALEQEAKDERRELERELKGAKRECATAWDHNADLYARMTPIADNLKATQERQSSLMLEKQAVARELEVTKAELTLYREQAKTYAAAMNEIRDELGSLPGENTLVTVRRVAAKLKGG